jgi:hypothetical protein
MTTEKWVYMNKGSEEYLSKIGLFKTLFKLPEEPLAIAVLTGGRSTQVKVKYEGAPWQMVTENNS